MTQQWHLLDSLLRQQRRTERSWWRAKSILWMKAELTRSPWKGGRKRYMPVSLTAGSSIAMLSDGAHDGSPWAREQLAHGELWRCCLPPSCFFFSFSFLSVSCFFLPPLFSSTFPLFFSPLHFAGCLHFCLCSHIPIGYMGVCDCRKITYWKPVKLLFFFSGRTFLP